MTLPLLMPPVRSTIGPSLLVVDGRSAVVTALQRTSPEELVLTGDASFVIAFQSWLGEWLEGKSIARTADLITYGPRYNEVERSSFASARITRLSFPSLAADLPGPAHSSGRAYITLRLQVTGETQMPGSGKQVSGDRFVSRLEWFRGDFYFRVGDRYKPTRISEIICPAPGVVQDIQVRTFDSYFEEFDRLRRFGGSPLTVVGFGSQGWYDLGLFQLACNSRLTQLIRDPRAVRMPLDLREKTPLDFTLSIVRPHLLVP